MRRHVNGVRLGEPLSFSDSISGGGLGFVYCVSACACSSNADFSLAARRYLYYYNAQCHPFRWGHKRKRRVFLVAPLRRTVLWGRASGASLPVRFARRLAKMIIT